MPSTRATSSVKPLTTCWPSRGGQSSRTQQQSGPSSSCWAGRTSTLATERPPQGTTHPPSRPLIESHTVDQEQSDQFSELTHLAATARAAEKHLTTDALRDACADLYTLVAQAAADLTRSPQSRGVDACDEGAWVDNKDSGAWDWQIDRATDDCSRPDPDGALSHSERHVDLGDGISYSSREAGGAAWSGELDLRARFLLHNFL